MRRVKNLLKSFEELSLEKDSIEENNRRCQQEIIDLKADYEAKLSAIFNLFTGAKGSEGLFKTGGKKPNLYATKYRVGPEQSQLQVMGESESESVGWEPGETGSENNLVLWSQPPRAAQGEEYRFPAAQPLLAKRREANEDEENPVSLPMQRVKRQGSEEEPAEGEGFSGLDGFVQVDKGQGFKTDE